MRIATAFGLILLLSAHGATAQEQSKILKNCPVLTPVEAAGVLGPGTLFASGAEAISGTVRISLLCEFVQADRTLTITASKTLGTKDTWEMLRKLSKGTLEAGLGEFAYSEVVDGKAHFFIVKGPLTLELRIGGSGASVGDVPKLREAAKKAFAKL